MSGSKERDLNQHLQPCFFSNKTQELYFTGLQFPIFPERRERGNLTLIIGEPESGVTTCFGSTKQPKPQGYSGWWMSKTKVSGR